MENKNLSQQKITRITALWALSESALGGLLHAFRLPFTGLIIGGFAVVFICLLANFCANKKTILTSTLVVMLIKFTISPHTPLTAYLAVSLQGFIGYVFFSAIPSFNIAALLLGITTQLLSAFQRVITITVVFGETFWESIDAFALGIINKFSTAQFDKLEFSASLLLILCYAFIHLLGGIYFAFLGIKLPRKLKKINSLEVLQELRSIDITSSNKKRKKWYRRKMPRLILIMFGSAFILTYIFPVTEANFFLSVVYMLIRAAVIITLWVTVVSPILMQLVKKYFLKKKSSYGDYYNSIEKLLPMLRKTTVFSWNESKKYPGIARVTNFVALTLSISLTLDLESLDKDEANIHVSK